MATSLFTPPSVQLGRDAVAQVRQQGQVDQQIFQDTLRVETSKKSTLINMLEGLQNGISIAGSIQKIQSTELSMRKKKLDLVKQEMLDEFEINQIREDQAFNDQLKKASAAEKAAIIDSADPAVLNRNKDVAMIALRGIENDAQAPAALRNVVTQELIPKIDPSIKQKNEDRAFQRQQQQDRFAQQDKTNIRAIQARKEAVTLANRRSRRSRSRSEKLTRQETLEKNQSKDTGKVLAQALKLEKNRLNGVFVDENKSKQLQAIEDKKIKIDNAFALSQGKPVIVDGIRYETQAQANTDLLKKIQSINKGVDIAVDVIATAEATQTTDTQTEIADNTQEVSPEAVAKAEEAALKLTGKTLKQLPPKTQEQFLAIAEKQVRRGR